MAFQVSPGVQVKEIDLTNVVPAVSTSIGAMVGDFNAGPIGEITTISSESELVSVFGQPSEATYVDFMQAASFLKYGRSLRVIRVDSGATNATADGTGLAINNSTVYEEDFSNGEASVGAFAARAPGTIGNGVIVSVCPADATEFSGWAYASEFDGAPGTSDYVSEKGGSDDELHVIVVDSTGNITGTPGAILEKFAYLSAEPTAKKVDGSTNYYWNAIAQTSSYVYVMDNTSAVTTGSAFNYSANAVQTVTLAGASNGTATAGSYSDALDMFKEADTVDINLLISPVDDNGSSVYATKVIEVAEYRRDLVAFISPPLADTVGSADPTGDVINYFSTLASTSYAVADSASVKMYDKYNDVFRWVPSNGHTAGLCAYTDGVADAWFSPAGLNRGNLLGVTKLSFNPNRTQRDDLYKARVNPIVSFPGEGTVLYGDKTMLSRPSAFDRINVRRLFIVLEKAIATAAKYQLFELNDEFTRAQFRNMVEPFLRDVKGRRGVTDFLVVCDGSNNTGQVIDTNNFVADIYVKPARSINFITLNFIATRTGVEFSEIAGQ